MEDERSIQKLTEGGGVALRTTTNKDLELVNQSIM